MAIFSDLAVKKNGNTSTSIPYTRGATDATWSSPNEDERWYLSDAIRDYNFYAYYPVGTATSYTSVELPSISGQDGTKTLTALKEENDFMRGATTTKATVNLSNGIVTCVGGLTTVTLHQTSGFALTPTAISIPIKIYRNRVPFKCNLPSEAKPLRFKTLSTTSFVGGRVYNHQIEINADIASSQVGDPFIFDRGSVNGNPLTPIIPN